MPVDDLSAAHLAAQAGAFEQQRGNNALLRIFDLSENAVKAVGREILTLSLQSFPLPTETTEVIETQYLNERRKIAGTTNWEDIEVAFKDFVDVQTARIVKLWREKVVDPVTGKNGLARDYKKRGEVQLFAPDGTHERFYTLEGAWPSVYTPGTIDMTSGEPVLLTVSLTIDKAYAARGRENVNLIPA